MPRFTPTGRRLRGSISDWVTVREGSTLHEALVFHESYRPDALLDDEEVYALRHPGRPGLVVMAPGVFVYATGPARCVQAVWSVLAEDGGAGARAALELAVHAGEALQQASLHTGRLHGGLTHSSLHLTPQGEPLLTGHGLPPLELLDWRADVEQTPALATLRCWPPERFAAEAEDLSSDLYSLAVIAAELATGQAVYGGPLEQVLEAAIAGDAIDRVAELDLDPRVRGWLTQMLAAYPDERMAAEAWLEKGRALLLEIEGQDLAATYQAAAEYLSEEEVEVVEGWELPVPGLAAPLEPASEVALELVNTEELLNTEDLVRTEEELELEPLADRQLASLARSLAEAERAQAALTALGPGDHESYLEARERLEASVAVVQRAHEGGQKAHAAQLPELLDQASDRARDAAWAANQALEEAKAALEQAALERQAEAARATIAALELQQEQLQELQRRANQLLERAHGVSEVAHRAAERAQLFVLEGLMATEVAEAAIAQSNARAACEEAEEALRPAPEVICPLPTDRMAHLRRGAQGGPGTKAERYAALRRGRGTPVQAPPPPKPSRMERLRRGKRARGTAAERYAAARDRNPEDEATVELKRPSRS